MNEGCFCSMIVVMVAQCAWFMEFLGLHIGSVLGKATK
jgi:hypothetical protein